LAKTRSKRVSQAWKGHGKPFEEISIVTGREDEIANLEGRRRGIVVPSDLCGTTGGWGYPPDPLNKEA